MNKREPHPQTHEAAEADAARDIDAIGHSLNTTPQEVWSLEDGPGWSFRVGEHRQTTFALFPGNDGRAPAVALRTADLTLRFHPSDQPTRHPADIIFSRTDEKQTTELSLTNQGEVTLWLTPHRQVVEDPVSAPAPATGVPSLSEAAEPALPGHPGAKFEASGTPGQPEKEQARRFEGLVAATPWFKARERDQKFIGGFPLSIGEKGKRQWVDVYVSEDPARDLQAQVEEGLISKRSEVTVVGSPRRRRS